MRTYRCLLWAMLLSLTTAFGARGAIIVRYTFPTVDTTTETSDAYKATTLISNVSATKVSDTAATTIQSSDAATAPASAPYLRHDPAGSSASAAAAVAGGKYWIFTVTADAGYELDLSSLTFNVARGGGSTPRGYAVRSSVDSYAANLATADVGTIRPTWTPVSVDLSGSAYQDLAAITFRVYSYSPGAGSSVDYDDVTLNGSVAAVPEPAALGLMCLSALGLLRRRASRS